MKYGKIISKSSFCCQLFNSIEKGAGEWGGLLESCIDLESIGDGAAVVFRSVVEESNFPVRERREEHV